MLDLMGYGNNAPGYYKWLDLGDKPLAAVIKGIDERVLSYLMSLMNTVKHYRKSASFVQYG